MNYRIDAATKEEWAERALSGEKKLAILENSIKETHDNDMTKLEELADCYDAAFDAAEAADWAAFSATTDNRDATESAHAVAIVAAKAAWTAYRAELKKTAND